jgi:BirA family biotin operon repressor/biotin-[acetyl-CoA-carboxylase] ligase
LDTLFTGKIETFVAETTSTNELAAHAVKSSRVIEGAAFRAGYQTKGKGQRGREWSSTANQNVLVSYVYFPVFLKSDEQFCLIKAVSLAVKDLLDKYLMDKATIKWPNDIYINNLKIAGILIESTMKGAYMGSSVIGIGLNVNQSVFDPRVNATSIVLETGQGCNLNMFFQELSFHLENRYLMLKRNTRSLDVEYLNSLYRLNTKSEFVVNEENRMMTINGVDELGQIILTDENGTQDAYGLHQIKMVI